MPEHPTDAQFSFTFVFKQALRCDIIDGTATYKLKFKRLTIFKNCKVILTVNGEKVTVDIQKGMSAR